MTREEAQQRVLEAAGNWAAGLFGRLSYADFTDRADYDRLFDQSHDLENAIGIVEGTFTEGDFA